MGKTIVHHIQVDAGGARLHTKKNYAYKIHNAISMY